MLPVLPVGIWVAAFWVNRESANQAFVPVMAPSNSGACMVTASCTVYEWGLSLGFVPANAE